MEVCEELRLASCTNIFTVNIAHAANQMYEIIPSIAVYTGRQG